VISFLLQFGIPISIIIIIMVIKTQVYTGNEVPVLKILIIIDILAIIINKHFQYIIFSQKATITSLCFYVNRIKIEFSGFLFDIASRKVNFQGLYTLLIINY